MTDAFFERDGDRFVATGWTRGPWDEGSQHAGPPAALLGRAIEALEPTEGFAVARFTLEILRPIPVARLGVEARVTRPGRRVQFCEATMTNDAGEDVARAAAWRIAVSPEPIEEIELEPTPHPPAEDCPAFETFRPQWEPSYLLAMEWRKVTGSFWDPGPAATWARMRHPLVSGEEPSPLTRVLTLADSGNGISAVMPVGSLFINTELTVHLVRPAEGEWICLDAITRIGPRGTGLAQSVIWDRRTRIGAGAQALLIAPA